MRADNSRHLIAAARKRAEQTRRRAIRALGRLDAAGTPITFDAVAREAGVSRSWLYAQPDLRDQIQHLRHRRTAATQAATPRRQQASDASLLRRLEVATERIRRLEQDNRQLRQALAEALGEARNKRLTASRGRRDTPEEHTPKLLSEH
jgi:hypothetical protein